jgi:DNA modification methylase
MTDPEPVAVDLAQDDEHDEGSVAEITWTTETRKLGELVPWPRNPRQIRKDQAKRLRESFEQFGQVETIAIGPGCEVYNGHQRLAVLMEQHGAGYEVEVRVSSRPLSEKEREKLTVFLHEGAAGEWNMDELANWDLGDLADWGFDLDARGLELPVDEPPDEPATIAPDRFDEVAKKWGTADGQIWQLGDHRILCGDSLQHTDILRLMGDEYPALVIADPPYGVNIVATNVSVGGGEAYAIPFGGRKKGYVGGGNSIKDRTGHYPIESWKKGKAALTGSDGASKPFGSKKERGSVGAAHVVEAGKYPVVIGDENTETAERAVSLYRGLYSSAVQVWWGANYYSPVLPASMGWLVWDKETTGNFADCELAWTNQEKAAKLFRHRWNGMLRDSERERRWHPTQKPAALAAWVYDEFTKPGDVVLDPFGGAGWSVLAGEQTGRNVRAIEMSHEYVAVICERWADMTGREPVLVND